ncbi:MAG: hypothetical protein E6848_25870, partial [Bradyrhizobium sp.]|nr:hypothetical protein [Bradyrhizobium sp.]
MVHELQIGGRRAFRIDMARIFHLLSAGLLTIALGGCETVAGSVAVVDDAGTTVTISEPGDVKYYPSDEPLRLGEEYFNR